MTCSQEIRNQLRKSTSHCLPGINRNTFKIEGNVHHVKLIFIKILELLMPLGDAINLQNEDEETLLSLAAAAGDSFSLKRILQEGPDTNIETKCGETALTKMINYCSSHSDGRLADIAALLLSGASKNHIDKKGNTPAMTLFCGPGTRLKEVSVLDILMPERKRINVQNQDGDSLLSLIVREADYANLLEMVNMAIEAGADPSLVDMKGNTAAMLLFKRRNIGERRPLFQTDIEHQLQFGHSHTESESIVLQVLTLILPKGEFVNYRSETGTSLLPLVASTGAISLLGRLLADGADPNIQDENGQTALFKLMDNLFDFEDRKQGIKLLIKAGALINHEDKNGDTALNRSWVFYYNIVAFDRFEEEMQVLHELIAHGADVNHENKQKDTPLGMVCRYMRYRRKDNPEQIPRILVYLLNAGADVNTTDQEGYTPFMALLDSMDGILRLEDKQLLQIVRLCLENGLDMQHLDKEGNTYCTALLSLYTKRALYGTRAKIENINDKNTRQYLKEMVSAMVAAEIDVKHKNKVGNTIMEYAWAMMEPEVVSLIRQNEGSVDGFVPRALLSTLMPGTISDELLKSPTLLHLACYQNSLSGVSYLLHHGAKMTSHDNGITPLGLNLMFSTTPDICLQFLYHGHQVNICVADGITLIDALQANQPVEPVMLTLIAAGLEVPFAPTETKPDSATTMPKEETPVSVGQTGKEHTSECLRRDLYLCENPLKRLRLDITQISQVMDHSSKFLFGGKLKTLKQSCRMRLRQELLEVTHGTSIVRNVERLIDNLQGVVSIPSVLVEYLLLEEELQMAGFVKISKDRLPSLQDHISFYQNMELLK